MGVSQTMTLHDHGGVRVIPVQIVGLQFVPDSVVSVVLLGELGESGEVKRVLPIFIGPAEASAIVVGLSGTVPHRPLTHDLLLDVLRTSHGKLTGVEVVELRQGTFLADLVVSADNGERRISARPSDGIALAVRCAATISVADQVLDDAAVPVTHNVGEPFADEDIEQIVTDFQNFLMSAEPADFLEGDDDRPPE
jgi:uncharacterized protein